MAYQMTFKRYELKYLHNIYIYSKMLILETMKKSL